MVSFSAALSAVDARENQLHAAFAERRLPDDDRAVVVLERAGDDLARARARAVHQHDQRVVGLGAAPRRASPRAPRRRRPSARSRRRRGSDRRRAWPDRAGRRGCRAGRAPAPFSCSLLLQLGERRVELVGGAGLELLQPHVADAGAERRGLDGLDLDLLAHELERARALSSPRGRRDAPRSSPSCPACRAADCTASSSGMLSVDSLLILVMRSSRFRPARPAGVPGIGRITVSMLIADRDHDAEPAEVARRRQVHLRGTPRGSGTRCADRACAACRCRPRTRRRADRRRCPCRFACKNANTSRRRADTSQGPARCRRGTSADSVSTWTLTLLATSPRAARSPAPLRAGCC